MDYNDPLAKRYAQRSKEPKKTQAQIREIQIKEQKIKLKEGLYKFFDLREHSSWTIKHINNEGYEDVVSLEGIYFDIIEYVLKKWDSFITPRSKVEISQTTTAKKIDSNILQRRDSLLKKKASLEKELEKVNLELEGL